MPNRLFNQSINRLFGVVTSALFLLTAFIPQGYMVEAGGETDSVLITICSSLKHRQTLVNVDTGEILESENLLATSSVWTKKQPNTTDSTDSSQICPFSLVTAGFVFPGIFEAAFLESGPARDFPTGSVSLTSKQLFRLFFVRAPPFSL